MKTNLLYSILLLLPFHLFANGVGSSMDSVLQTDFASFFNISKQKTDDLDFQQKKHHYKTGGFQEFIDLHLTTNKENILTTASIEVHNQFIKDQTIFAIDVIKSFIKDFAHHNDQSVTETLANKLYMGEGYVDPILKPILKVLAQEKSWGTVQLKNCIFEMNLSKTGLVITYYFINWKEQSIDSKLFLQKSHLKSYQLECTQTEKDFHVWTLLKDKTSDYSRLVDGRWAFNTAEEAAAYYKAHLLEQSEGAQKIEGFDKKLGDESIVFFYDKSNNPLMATLDLNDKYYYFYFRKGKYIAKVFVVANANIKVEQAYPIAQKAEKLLK